MCQSKLYKEVEEKVKNIVVSHLQLGKSAEELNPADEIFLESYGFNSVDALELLLQIEQEFDIEIADEDLNAELVRTVETLACYITKCLENRG